MTGDEAQGRIPIQTKDSLVLTSMGIRECSDSGTFVGYVSSVFVLLTQTQTPMIRYTNTKSCLRTSSAKRENILRLALSGNVNS